MPSGFRRYLSIDIAMSSTSFACLTHNSRIYPQTILKPHTSRVPLHHRNGLPSPQPHDMTAIIILINYLIIASLAFIVVYPERLVHSDAESERVLSATEGSEWMAFFRRNHSQLFIISFGRYHLSC
jgi:hypothetical protein